MKRADSRRFLLPPELHETMRQEIFRTLVSLAKYVDAHRLQAKMPGEIAQEMHADMVPQLEALVALGYQAGLDQAEQVTQMAHQNAEDMAVLQRAVGILMRGRR